MNILTAEEVAKLLRVDKRTIQRLAKKKYYPQNVCAKVGRQYRFIEEELKKFIFSKQNFVLGE